jgi:hypothetical protein
VPYAASTRGSNSASYSISLIRELSDPRDVLTQEDLYGGGGESFGFFEVGSRVSDPEATQDLHVSQD